MAAVDLRYARALEQVVLEKKLARADVRQQLEDFVTLYGDNASIREILGDPSIPQEQKVRFLDALAPRMGMSGTVRNFVAVVTAHERLHELREIVEAYLALADQDGGVVDAEVTSARALDEAGRRELEQSVARMAGGSQVRATYHEDPALIGGAVVRVGSTVYDGSVRGQLEQMRRRMMAAVA